MLRRCSMFLVAGVLAVVVFGAEAEAGTVQHQERGAGLSTAVLQTGATAGVATLGAGTGVAMVSYLGAHPPGSTPEQRAFVYGPMGLGGLGLVALTPIVTPLTLSLVASARGANNHFIGPAAGTVLGGVIGTVSSAAVATGVWEAGLDWQNRRWRSGFVVGLPFAAGLTVGALAGYWIQEALTEEPEPRHFGPRAEVPTVSPVVGTPVGAEDSGWTLGASLRF